MVQLPSYSKVDTPNLKRLSEEVGLILASGSPRRRMILNELRIDFEIMIPTIEEKLEKGLAYNQQAIGLARQKVDSVKKELAGAYLGCDTIVVYKDKIMVKPTDEDDAMRILTTLSGNTHSVFTGLALYDSNHNICFTGVEESRVRFKDISRDFLSRYIATGEPMDKAGAYGIQDMGRFLVDTVEGNIDNVIGLPLQELEILCGLLLGNYER